MDTVECWASLPFNKVSPTVAAIPSFSSCPTQTGVVGWISFGVSALPFASYVLVNEFAHLGNGFSNNTNPVRRFKDL